VIKKIYHSKFSPEYRNSEPGSAPLTNEFYGQLQSSDIPDELNHSPARRVL
jgi:hypothetical protein